MNVFFNLMWRHIFAIEILKEYYQVNADSKRENQLIAWLQSLRVVDRKRAEAKDYLLEYKDSFWQDTDYRVTEILKKQSDEAKKALKISAGGKYDVISGDGSYNFESIKSLSDEQKIEVKQIAQNVVNSLQINKLSKCIELIKDYVLTDEQKKYYILIDDLDTDWVDESFRYQILHSLIETIKMFNQEIPSLKIIIALREDLLVRTYRLINDPGHQFEKVQDLIIHLKWKNTQLIKLVNNRLEVQSKKRNIQNSANFSAVTPSRVTKKETNAIGYLLDRTLLRPRDIIMFFNECIKIADGKSKMSANDIKDAEYFYSESRLDALYDEWKNDYFSLKKFCKLFEEFDDHFLIANIKALLLDRMLELCTNGASDDEHDMKTLRDRISLNPDDALNDILRILVRVGFLGVKATSFDRIVWDYERPVKRDLSQDNYANVVFYIHKAFWRYLGIKEI